MMDMDLNFSLSSLSVPQTSPIDQLSICFHMVMERLLFTNSDKNDEHSLWTSEGLDKFRTAAGIVFRFAYSNTDIQVQVTIISISDIIQIHVHLPPTSENWIFTVHDITEYVDSTNNTVKFDMLSYRFNQCVGAKLVQRVRQLAGLEVGLLQLPEDIIRIIYRYLDMKSVIKLSMVCKVLLDFGREKSLWLSIVKRKYQNLEAMISSANDDIYSLVANFEREKFEKRKAAEKKKAELEWRSRRNFPGLLGHGGNHLNHIFFPNMDHWW